MGPVSSPYRIAMVESGGWGGIGHYTYNLSSALSARGHRVSLITGRPYELAGLPRGFDLRDSLEAEAPYPEKLDEVARALRIFRPHVVHVQSTFSARRDWLPILALRLLGTPVVLTAHNVMPHDREERDALFMKTAYRLLYRSACHLIVHGHAPRKQLAARFGVPASRSTVIPHGDYAFAGLANQPGPEEARSRLGLPPSGRVLLCFGALREYKGIPDLIRAFARAPIRNSKAFLLIVGKPAGLDPRELQRLLDDQGLSGRSLLRAEYVPFDEIGVYFRAADAVVLPYRGITQSGALQLAYAFEKPVIVTRVGALPETVDEGGNGFIVPPADPDALARAITDLVALDDSGLARMGKRSRELADSRYGWDKIAASTERVYDKVRATRSRSPVEAP
jgi:glycosyltransferase involved in cell wall biosynthesis